MIAPHILTRAYDSYNTVYQGLWCPRFITGGMTVMTVADESELIEELANDANRSYRSGNHMPERSSTLDAYDWGCVQPSSWLSNVPKADDDQGSVLLQGCEAPMRALHDSIKPVMEDLVGQKLTPTEGHGPRLYQRTSVMIGHTDGYPTHLFGVSVPLFFDQPWPMEFLDMSAVSDGVTRSVTAKKHDLIIYEGCRMMHARMTPYAGEAYCVALFHYVPDEFSTGLHQISKRTPKGG